MRIVRHPSEHKACFLTWTQKQSPISDSCHTGKSHPSAIENRIGKAVT